ncbi:putative serine carboxypeptidase-like 52 [Impatiens glandulifera]|uniref:putative serine carboxypeptidase-like 52 n=1 Tax=Impatiens glandulifera TaxID=253017 RepID=UPI001FB09335|nr:putative serine carboxypeptidase-like 52 [Impatiens glandulifera]
MQEHRLLRSSIWANDDLVQDALHVRKGSIGSWVRCNQSLSYIYDVKSVVNVHKELLSAHKLQLKVLVESGDHDLTIPFIGTLKWIKSINLTVTHKWRPWYIHNQVAG